jgi:hypothetical protein
MPMFAWGLDEVVEGIGLFYALLVGLLVLLVTMERGLPEAPKPHTRLMRELSQQWLDDADNQHEPVMVWLSRTPPGIREGSPANYASAPRRPSACSAWPATKRPDPGTGVPTPNAAAGHLAEPEAPR